MNSRQLFQFIKTQKVAIPATTNLREAEVRAIVLAFIDDIGESTYGCVFGLLALILKFLIILNLTINEDSIQIGETVGFLGSEIGDNTISSVERGETTAERFTCQRPITGNRKCLSLCLTSIS